MNNITRSTGFVSVVGMFGILAMAGTALAQENSGITSVPHTFQSGDVISADEMNSNFSALFDKIDGVSVQAGPKGDTGPTGPAGPQAIIIKDAGIFVGSIDTEVVGGNFSLLPGADGATGLAAADAACEASYPSSHAEIDKLALWKSGAAEMLPDGSYWASSKLDYPFDTLITTDCDDWTSGNTTGTGSERFSKSGGGVTVRTTDADEPGFPSGRRVTFAARHCDLDYFRQFGSDSVTVQATSIACYQD